MKPYEITLLKHKDFINVVARELISPQKDHDHVIEVLNAYNEIDKTAEVLAECATCQNIYAKTFKIILAYCENQNWFEVKPKTKKDAI